jgi:hypothetical protein
LGEASQFAVASNNAVTGNAGRVWIAMQSLAHGSVAGGFKAAGDVGVGDDFSAGDSRGDGPDLLRERHAGNDLSPADLILQTGCQRHFASNKIPRKFAVFELLPYINAPN